MSRKTILILGALYCSLMAPSLWANGSCSINSIAPVAFGTYNPASNDDNNGSFKLTNTGGNPTVVVSILQGNSSPSFSPRKMKSGANILNYNLYTNIGRTIIWGDGTSGTTKITAKCSTFVNTPIYGRIPIGQTRAPAGSYSDSVTLQITY